MEEIVHIVPLGFEIDRVVKPFGKLKANRVYILYSTKRSPKNPSTDQRNNPLHYLKAVKEQLDELNIDVVLQDIDIFNILELMSAISKIIVKEKADKNIVYVNMCSAGKLTSVATTLAAMYHDVKVYYVKADEYPTEENLVIQHGLSIVNNPDYMILTNFKIDIPTGAKGTLLVELNKKGQMTTNDIQKMIDDKKLEGFEDLITIPGTTGKSKQNKLMRINIGLLNELNKNGYISIEKRGRIKIIKISDKGRYAASLIGM